jgi:hypothetical protein
MIELTWGKEYKILSWSEPSEDGRQFLYIINDSGYYSEYLASRFVTKNKFREIQLEKLGV